MNYVCKPTSRNYPEASARHTVLVDIPLITSGGMPIADGSDRYQYSAGLSTPRIDSASNMWLFVTQNFLDMDHSATSHAAERQDTRQMDRWIVLFKTSKRPFSFANYTNATTKLHNILDFPIDTTVEGPIKIDRNGRICFAFFPCRSSG